MTIDTKKAPRRTITYATLDEVAADAKRLVAAGAQTSGNWSLGQILDHVASVMEKSIDGFDTKPPSWPVRLIGRWILRGRFLKHGMPSGFQLTGSAAKELIPEEVDAQQALDHLCRAAERLKTESHRAVNPFFGSFSPEESNRFNCRHAELHMSFIQDA